MKKLHVNSARHSGISTLERRVMHCLVAYTWPTAPVADSGGDKQVIRLLENLQPDISPAWAMLL